MADHYRRSNLLWTRLKGLMVYPALVLLVSLGLTLVISLVFGRLLGTLFAQFAAPSAALITMWIPPVVLMLAGVVGACALSWPVARRRLRWRLPAFREASLAQLASAIALMLRKGTTLADAVALAQHLEEGSPAATALARWRESVEAGRGKPADWTLAPPFPKLQINSFEKDKLRMYYDVCEKNKIFAIYYNDKLVFDGIEMKDFFELQIKKNKIKKS